MRGCGAFSTGLSTLVFHEDGIEVVVAEGLHGFTVFKLVSTLSGETESASGRTVLNHHGGEFLLAAFFDVLFAVDDSS